MERRTDLSLEPRTRNDYGNRLVEAARRVLVDLGQVLATFFEDSIVIVGGWVPELLLPGAEESHVGSLDVDLALDPTKLREGRYADILKALLATRRYQRAELQFRLRTEVDLRDGGPVPTVDVDFLKPPRKHGRSSSPRALRGFRPLDADACAAAFRRPIMLQVEGHTVDGTRNRVSLRVASLEDFLVMKACALAGRDKPKDAYDLCYCLDHHPDGIEALALAWRDRLEDRFVKKAVASLHDKFATVHSYGSQQVAAFYGPSSHEEREMRVRRAYELVRRFLEEIGS